MNRCVMVVDVNDLGAPHGQGCEGKEESTVGEAEDEGGKAAPNRLGGRRYIHD